MRSLRQPYLILLLAASLWCLGLIAAPLLQSAGDTVVSGALYALFSRICHQLPERSFHMFGEHAGVCIRCFAIYFGFLFSLSLLPFLKRLDELNIPTPKLFVAALAPMVLDALLNDTGAHASTTFTRIFTGVLLGVVLPWFVVPPFLEAFSQIRQRSNSIGDSPHARKTQ
ncbi:MAG: DUF2085 domain-containing protein [Bacteroidota bacterium]